ncbi:hypothetical protein EDC01DRAFT_638956 [Geopyxis carbonaria]|nr:hypothetical protein EDC01DRAFT_638956 [Geopyxis carbonaria]
MPFPTVALAGGSGLIGTPILRALAANPTLKITLLVRATSPLVADPPADTTVVVVDFDSPASLAAALTGISAVVSALPLPALHHQTALIAAAATAGVRRFIISEYGCDPHNAHLGALPPFSAKVAAFNALRAQDLGALSWTSIACGPFLDFTLPQGFLGVDPARGEATVYGDGESVVSTTTLADVAQAVVGVLTAPDEALGRNEVVYVESMKITQNLLVRLARRVWPERELVVRSADVDELEAQAWRDIEEGGEAAGRGFVAFYWLAMWKPANYYGCDFGEKHKSREVGIQGMDEEALGMMWKNLLEEKKE